MNSWRSTSRSAPYLTSNSSRLPRRNSAPRRVVRSRPASVLRSSVIRTGVVGRNSRQSADGAPNGALMAHGAIRSQEEPRSSVRKILSTWSFAVERVTGIEPALSAWEAVPSGPVTWPDLRGGVSASDRERPLVTGVNGPLMARRTAARPAPVAASWSSPVLLDSCRPSGRGRCVKAREATACGLALTRRTRPRQLSSEEDARRLHPLRPEPEMPDVALPEKWKVGSSTLPLTTSFRLVPSALTSTNAAWVLSCSQPSSDHDYPSVTVVGRLLSHVDRMSRSSEASSTFTYEQAPPPEGDGACSTDLVQRLVPVDHVLALVALDHLAINVEGFDRVAGPHSVPAGCLCILRILQEMHNRERWRRRDRFAPVDADVNHAAGEQIVYCCTLLRRGSWGLWPLSECEPDGSLPPRLDPTALVWLRFTEDASWRPGPRRHLPACFRQPGRALSCPRPLPRTR